MLALQLIQNNESLVIKYNFNVEVWCLESCIVKSKSQYTGKMLID